MIRIYKLDVNKSEIAWVAFQPSGEQTGKLYFEDGKFYTKGKNLMEADLIIDMESLVVTSESLDEKNKLKLAEHLLSKDFFNVKTYPTTEFMFLDIKPLDTNEEISSPTDPAEKVHTHEVEGELTIRGITQRIKIPVYLEINERELKAESKFLFYRTKWGMDYMIEPTYGEKRVLPEFQVSFDLVARSTQKTLVEEESEYQDEEMMEAIS